MENYISINNRRIELNDDQVRRILLAADQQKTKLSSITVGDTFKIGKYELVVLSQDEGYTSVITKALVADAQAFGKSNNYAESEVDVKCQEFAQELACVIGWDNIVLHEVDLTSDDGLKDYGVLDRRASLLTADRYRRYVEILDKHKIDAWWWLATPWSTARHDHEVCVLCVAPSGSICNGDCDDDNGVRPFCILKSSIFVSG